MTSNGGHDIRPNAREIKFIVNSGLGHVIRETVRLVMSPDPHASGPASDEYRTTTLYFDTGEFDAFHRRGSHGRAKYRVRRYGQSDVVFLERKLRTGDVLSKRRSTVQIGDLKRLAGRVLEAASVDRWFHERLLVRRLSPVCQVAYSRTARVGMTEHGPIRLTLDEQLSAMPIDAPEFQQTEGQRLLAGKTIVELKFTTSMPTVFKRLIEEFALEPARVSKYRLAAERTRNLVADSSAPGQTNRVRVVAHAGAN